MLSLSGIAAVVWLEGVNDFSKNGHAPVEAVDAGMKVARLGDSGRRMLFSTAWIDEFLETRAMPRSVSGRPEAVTR